MHLRALLSNHTIEYQIEFVNLLNVRLLSDLIVIIAIEYQIEFVNLLHVRLLLDLIIIITIEYQIEFVNNLLHVRLLLDQRKLMKGSKPRTGTHRAGKLIKIYSNSRDIT